MRQNKAQIPWESMKNPRASKALKRTLNPGRIKGPMHCKYNACWLVLIYNTLIITNVAKRLFKYVPNMLL